MDLQVTMLVRGSRGAGKHESMADLQRGIFPEGKQTEAGD